MKKILNFKHKTILLVLFLVLASLCYYGIMVYLNFSEKAKQNATQARQSEYDFRIFSLGRNIINGTEASLALLEGISRIARESRAQGTDYNNRIVLFLQDTKDISNALKVNATIIEMDMKGLDNHPLRNQSWTSVKKLYQIYSWVRSLDVPQSDSLDQFDARIANMRAEFEKEAGRLKAIMPGLAEAPPPAAEAAPQAPVAGAVAAMDDHDNPFIACVKNALNFSDAEKALGLPAEKRRGSSGQEVWIYPSEKAGFQYRLYFSSGAASSWKLLPQNTEFN